MDPLKWIHFDRTAFKNNVWMNKQILCEMDREGIAVPNRVPTPFQSLTYY